MVRLALLGGTTLALAGQTVLIASMLLLGTLLVPGRPGVGPTVQRLGVLLGLLALTWHERGQLIARLVWPANPWAGVWPAAFVAMIACLWADHLVRRLLAWRPQPDADCPELGRPSAEFHGLQPARTR